MKKLLLFSIVVLLAGCSAPTGGMTAEAAARDRVLLTEPHAQNIQVLGVRSTPEGQWIIIYTYFVPSDGDLPGMFNLGYGT
jgi:hypothetical protein